MKKLSRIEMKNLMGGQDEEEGIDNCSRVTYEISCIPFQQCAHPGGAMTPCLYCAQTDRWGCGSN